MDQQDQNPNPSDGDQSAPAAAGPGISRRGLLRGGAAASPILLTLASGPVAATGSCVVASSFVSATVYKSRNPGATNISCIVKTARNLCDEARVTAFSASATSPHKTLVSSFMNGPVSCTSGVNTFNLTSRCYHVFKNSVENTAGTGTGLQPAGDIAVLQRLLALSYGAPTVFTKNYCQQIWAARNTPSLLAALVNDRSNVWNPTRLMAWLDYSANGVTF